MAAAPRESTAGMTEPAQPGGLRVATMNLWGTYGAWPQRRKALLTGFRELRPDLVLFQEAVETPAQHQAAEVLGAGYHFVHHSLREPDGRGLSAASRWPVSQVRELDLHISERTAGFPRSALLTEIAAPPPVGPLLLVNHLPNWQLDLEYERGRQAVITARAIEEMVAGRPLHVVLAGDFDADPAAASIRFWSGREALEGVSVCYRDAWESARPGEPGDTYTPDNPLLADWDWPFRRIDYIFVRCGAHGGPTLAIQDCRRIFDQPVDGAWASDHFGVCADLVTPPPLPPGGGP
jgi:endonuclease/exonuclease/phosphatase family metal-dependent hydrolase